TATIQLAATAPKTERIGGLLYIADRQYNCPECIDMAKVPLTQDHVKTGKFILNVESVGLSPDQFFRLCGDNPELRLELTAQKEIIVMSPTNSKTGMLNAEISRQLGNWAEKDGRGVVFDTNTGFT